MPVGSGHNFMNSFIEHSKPMEAITDFPLLWSDSLQSNGLLSQHLREVNESTAPLDFTVVAHLANHHPGGVMDQGNFTTIAACGDTIDRPRGLSC